ncbi:MAG: metallophosphoesterase family protein [Lachnospira sp.]
MLKIMIVSDTHRRHGNLAIALEKESPIDMLIHLGDVEGEEEIIDSLANCETLYVSGNNDFFSLLSKEREIILGGKKIFITHGHYYYISLDTKTIREEAMSRGADIVMFGHTHRPLIDVGGRVTLINPGSISYPRQSDGLHTYIIMTIDDNNEISFELKSVEDL